jgi:hypothetical protein
MSAEDNTHGSERESKRRWYQPSKGELQREEDSLYDTDTKSLKIPPSTGSTWLRESMQPSDHAKESESRAFQSQVQDIQPRSFAKGLDSPQSDPQRETTALCGCDLLANGQTLMEDINRTLAIFEFSESSQSRYDNFETPLKLELSKATKPSESTDPSTTIIDSKEPLGQVLSDASSTYMIPPPPTIKPLGLPSVTPLTTASIWRLSRSHADPAFCSWSLEETQAGRVPEASQKATVSSNRSKNLD